MNIQGDFAIRGPSGRPIRFETISGTVLPKMFEQPVWSPAIDTSRFMLPKGSYGSVWSHRTGNLLYQDGAWFQPDQGLKFDAAKWFQAQSHRSGQSGGLATSHVFECGPSTLESISPLTGWPTFAMPMLTPRNSLYYLGDFTVTQSVDDYVPWVVEQRLVQFRRDLSQVIRDVAGDKVTVICPVTVRFELGQASLQTLLPTIRGMIDGEMSGLEYRLRSEVSCDVRSQFRSSRKREALEGLAGDLLTFVPGGAILKAGYSAWKVLRSFCG